MITIETIDVGEALRWSWLFPPYRWHFGARSHADTEIVAITALALRECAAEVNHDFGYELAMRIGKVTLRRLQATRLQLANFSMVRFLIDFFHAYGASVRAYWRKASEHHLLTAAICREILRRGLAFAI